MSDSQCATFPIYLSHLCFHQDGGKDEAPVRVLMKADPSSRESLQAEAEVDPMDGEQTWPTESELLEAEGAKTDLIHNNILRLYEVESSILIKMGCSLTFLLCRGALFYWD